MKTQNFKQFAGWSGILSALLFVVSIIGMQFYIAGNLENTPAFIENMNQNNTMMLLYGWPGLVATILMLPLFFQLNKINDSNQRLSEFFLTISKYGIGFVLIGYLYHLTLTYFHAPIYESLDASKQAAFDAVFKTTIGIQDLFWLGGDLFAFLGIALLSILAIKERKIPKWILVLVALSGISAAIGSFNFLPVFKPNPVLEFMFISGFLAFTIWEIIFGIYLLKSRHS